MSQTRQRGFTLLEMVVAMSLAGILILMLSNMIGNGFKSYAYSQIEASSTTNLTLALDRMTSVLRSVTTVTTASANSLTVQAYFSPNDTVPSQITYSISGSNLIANVILATGSSPNYSFPVANQKTYTVLTNYWPGVNIFSYYDDNGNLLTGSFATTEVKQIGIYLQVDPNSVILKQPLSSQTTVTLRNMKTNL